MDMKVAELNLYKQTGKKLKLAKMKTKQQLLLSLDLL